MNFKPIYWIYITLITIILGIQHPINSFKFNMASQQKSGSASTMLTTTCFFHGGGFSSFFSLAKSPQTLVFNHGGDIGKSNV